VNGHCLFARPAGGFDGDVTLRRHTVELPLRAGKNLVALAVTRFPHHRYWTASLGIGTPVADGEREQLTSIYRGPILLAFDQRYNTMGPEQIPGLDARTLTLEEAANDLPYPAWLLLSARDAAGTPITLCDFATAGMTGNPYRSWLNVRGTAPAVFSPENPLRSVRPAEAESMR
jgi:hypothetical protein